MKKYLIVFAVILGCGSLVAFGVQLYFGHKISDVAWVCAGTSMLGTLYAIVSPLVMFS